MRYITRAISDIEYRTLLLSKQFDGGFGFVAESYHCDAKILWDKHKGSKLVAEALPTLFLARHSIELYLKSGIVILTRIIEEASPRSIRNYIGSLKLQIGDHYKPLLAIHDLRPLYHEWSRLLRENINFLNRCTEYHNWRLPRQNHRRAINQVLSRDPKSDFFRYPISKKDRSKDLAPSRKDREKTNWAVSEGWRKLQHDPRLAKATQDFIMTADVFGWYHNCMRRYLTQGR